MVTATRIWRAHGTAGGIVRKKVLTVLEILKKIR